MPAPRERNRAAERDPLHRNGFYHHDEWAVARPPARLSLEGRVILGVAWAIVVALATVTLFVLGIGLWIVVRVLGALVHMAGVGW